VAHPLADVPNSGDCVLGDVQPESKQNWDSFLAQKWAKRLDNN